MSLVDIAAQLEEPFPLEGIELLPKGQTERDGKTFCMAMPYADVRVYQDRLNKLAPGEWSTPPPLALVVGTKLVCYVTIVIYGVSHTDVGEAGPGENQGTEAFAQAFKRAASQFGLGRYLYNLDKAWVPYNVKRKQIDLDAAGVKNIVKQMYQKAGVSLSQKERRTVVTTPVQPANQAESDEKAAPQQLTAIRKLYEQLGKPEPEGLADFTFVDAKQMLADLSQELREARASKAEQPPQSAQSPAVQKMLVSAMNRVSALSMEWNAIKTEAKLTEVPDTELTVQQIAAINGHITKYEKKAS